MSNKELISLWDTESDFLRLLADIERVGIRLNQPFCNEMHNLSQNIMADIEEQLGFDPGKTNDLADFLFETLELPILKRGKPSKQYPQGRPRMNKEVMQDYELMLEASNDISASLILEWRGWQKADSACYAAYPKLVSTDGRLRPNFKLHGTKTGRLSCEKPNLQQIPRNSEKPWNGKAKRCFEFDPGYVGYEFDYKTLEFRLAALYAKEYDLIEQINQGRDVHAVMAEQLGIERHVAKTLNFAILYGAGAAKIALMLKKDQEESDKILAQFHNTYPGFGIVMHDAANAARTRGYVKYWTGRIRHFNTKWSFEYVDGERKTTYHKAFNSICQGGGAEITKQAMLRLRRFNNNNCRMVLQVHDSVVFEIREDLVDELVPQIKSEMEQVPLDVKFEVDAHRWGESG